MKTRKLKKHPVKDVDTRTNKLKNQTVTWYDAVQKPLDRDFIDSLSSESSGKDLLAINKTHGKILKLKDVVLIIHEESTIVDTDTSIIPKDWIISIK